MTYRIHTTKNGKTDYTVERDEVEAHRAYQRAEQTADSGKIEVETAHGWSTIASF